MKDCGEESLRNGRPGKSAAETVAFCLKMLFADCKHSIGDKVAESLTYEELLGTLLQAEDLIHAQESEEVDGIVSITPQHAQWLAKMVKNVMLLDEATPLPCSQDEAKQLLKDLEEGA